MVFAPFHDFRQFLPVIHLLEGHVLHRRSGNDHTVEFPVFQFVKGLVESQQMLLWGVFRLMSGEHHQFQMHLKGRVAQHTAQLCFGDDFRRHQIQQNNFQGADMLGFRPGLLHDKDILFLQYFCCGQIVWYLNRHGQVPPVIL